MCLAQYGVWYFTQRARGRASGSSTHPSSDSGHAQAVSCPPPPPCPPGWRRPSPTKNIAAGTEGSHRAGPTGRPFGHAGATPRPWPTSMLTAACRTSSDRTPHDRPQNNSQPCTTPPPRRHGLRAFFSTHRHKDGGELTGRTAGRLPGWLDGRSLAERLSIPTPAGGSRTKRRERRSTVRSSGRTVFRAPPPLPQRRHLLPVPALSYLPRQPTHVEHAVNLM